MARGSCGAKAPPPPRAHLKFRFEFELRDTEELEFLDLVDVWVVAFQWKLAACDSAFGCN